MLLIATMLRLALNLASTRLILDQRPRGRGTPPAHVIEAFGNLMMSGNFVIGVIVFAILVIVNFVVITKGSGRIAEVAARFTLDAMPGKQMAIDADLSAGLIDETEARQRRKTLEDESNFFGAMDGASKFVRGDAIAGLLIVFINIIGGIIIGAGAARPDARRGGADLHPADRRRRPGDADPGADRLDRGRPAGLQGRRRRLGRQGAVRPARRLSQGARHVLVPDDGDGAAAGHAAAAVPRAVACGTGGARLCASTTRKRRRPQAQQRGRATHAGAADGGADLDGARTSTSCGSSSATACCR